MLALSSSVLGYSAGVAPVASMQRAAVSMETKADLEALAVELNPVVKFCACRTAPVHARFL